VDEDSTCRMSTSARLWSALGVATAPGVPAAEIAAFEATHNVILPKDVAAFYAAFNGTVGTDDALLSFWPLAEIAPVPHTLSGFRGEAGDPHGADIVNRSLEILLGGLGVMLTLIATILLMDILAYGATVQ
jgi:hypothetical protein